MCDSLVAFDVFKCQSIMDFFTIRQIFICSVCQIIVHYNKLQKNLKKSTRKTYVNMYTHSIFRFLGTLTLMNKTQQGLKPWFTSTYGGCLRWLCRLSWCWHVTWRRIGCLNGVRLVRLLWVCIFCTRGTEYLLIIWKRQSYQVFSNY